MRLFTSLDWVHAQGAGKVEELSTHMAFWQAVDDGADLKKTAYADWLRGRGYSETRVWSIMEVRAMAHRGDLSPDPLPVQLNKLGHFELDDGHHRATRALYEGQPRISVEVKGVSPLWQRLVDDLESIYPERARYLYQSIEHPYFAGWTTSRSDERLKLVRDAVSEAGITPADGQYFEVGCCAGRFCREFSRQGFRVFGIDLDKTVLAAAEHLDLIMGTSCSYWNCSVGSDRFHELWNGGDGWALTVCLSVLHSHHTMGHLDWVAEQFRLLLGRSRALITDGDAPGREYRGGTAPPEPVYYAWLQDVAGEQWTVKRIGKTEGRMIYLLRRKS